MKKFFAIFFVAILTVTTACKKEETAGDQLDGAIEAGKDAADDAKKKMEEATK